MALRNATILDGASISATGGTSKSLTTDGQLIVNGVHLIDASVTDYRVRPNISARNRNPALQSDGTYGKGRRSMTITIPKVLANGKQGFPCFRLELEDFPEMTQAEIDKLKIWAAQCIIDSDFTSFWYTGSID